MKLKALVVSALIATPLFAQTEQKSEADLESSIQTSGAIHSGMSLTFGLGLGMTRVESKYTDPEETFRDKTHFSREYGIGAEYKNIRYQSIGYTAGLTLERYSKDLTDYTELGSETYFFKEEVKISTLTAEGNATMGLTEALYVYGGLNISDIVSGSGDAEDYKPGLGFQAGIGYRIIKNLSLDLKYAERNYKYEDSYEALTYDAALDEVISTREDFKTKLNFSSLVLSANLLF